MIDREHMWSPSRLARLQTCEESYRRRYVAGDPDPPGPEASVGLLVHAALAAVGRRWLAEGSFPLDAAALRAAAVAEATRANAAASPTTLRGALELLVEKVAGHPRLDLRDLVAAEEELEFQSPCGRLARGRADRIDLPEGRGPVVIDYKTGGEVASRAELEVRPQTLVYLAGARRRWPAPRPPPTMVYWFLARDRAVSIAWSPVLDELAGALVDVAAERLALLLDGPPAAAWAGAVGPACARCPFARDCGPLAEAMRADPAAGRPPEGAEVEEVLDRRQRAKAVEEAWGAIKAECSERLRPLVERGPVATARWHAYLRADRRRAFPSIDTTARALALATGADEAEVRTRIAGVDLGRLDAYLDEVKRDLRLDDGQRAALDAAVDATGAPDVAAYVRVDQVRTRL